MQYSAIILLALSAAQSATAAPNKLVARAPVFQATTWNDLSISGGTAGSCKEEALAKFAALPSDPAQVDKADITFLLAANQIANDAERGAYNVKIAASAPGEDALALQRGKIKNKCLKLTATVLALQAQQAQGDASVATKLTEETTKLNKNIASDQAEAGKASTLLTFDATTADPEKSNVAKDDALAQKAGDVVDASLKLVGGGNSKGNSTGAGEKRRRAMVALY